MLHGNTTSAADNLPCVIRKLSCGVGERDPVVPAETGKNNFRPGKGRRHIMLCHKRQNAVIAAAQPSALCQCCGKKGHSFGWHGALPKLIFPNNQLRCSVAVDLVGIVCSAVDQRMGNPTLGSNRQLCPLRCFVQCRGLRADQPVLCVLVIVDAVQPVAVSLDGVSVFRRAAVLRRHPREARRIAFLQLENGAKILINRDIVAGRVHSGADGHHQGKQQQRRQQEAQRPLRNQFSVHIFSSYLKLVYIKEPFPARKRLCCTGGRNESSNKSSVVGFC